MLYGTNFSQVTNEFRALIDQLDDPRNSQQTHYPLEEILFLLISASLCGIEDFTVMAAFGREKLDWLRKYFPYQRGVPAHDTLARVLGLIDKQGFEELFIDWMSQYCPLVESLTIHLDGKRITRSANRQDQQKKRSEGGTYPELMVNAYVSQTSMVIAQRSVSEDFNELRGMEELLELLNVEGCCITADSNFCGREIIKKIVENKADYILSLKAKSPKLYGEVEQAFEVAGDDSASYTTQEQGHGRVEKRVYQCLAVDHMDERITASYKKLKQIVRVKRERTILRSDQQQQQTNYYISSLEAPLEQLAGRIRRHWAIENELHWVLDVEFAEDASRKRTNNLAANASLIRKIALNLLRQNKDRESLKTKRMKCAISDNYREKILAFS